MSLVREFGASREQRKRSKKKWVEDDLIRTSWNRNLQRAVISLEEDRYRWVPTFGSDTIRKFTTNASEMKKLAARDFEDLLQVWQAPVINIFDG